MRKWLDRYYGSLRRVKANYVLFNLMEPGRMRQARRMFRKFGVKRDPLLPFHSGMLRHSNADLPWLDQENGDKALQQDPSFLELPAHLQNPLRSWPDKGYVILRGLFSLEEVNAVNAEVQRLITEKKVDFNFTGRKIMFANRKSALIRAVANDTRIKSTIDLLLRKKMHVFQTINFLTGSEQAPHSDSIHMTTHPLGYLAAAWIALENITPENGPLLFYPGSHKDSYLLNPDFDHGGGTFTIGKDAYARYETEVRKRIDTNGYEPVEFLAGPGDVLIWHANLLHGGKPMATPDISRKSMVIHYFADDVLCYHELTQRVALVDEGADEA